MAQKGGQSGLHAPTAVPEELSKMGEAQAEAVLAMHKELLQTYEQICSAWVERVKSEANLWSDLASRMTHTRSVPDALSAYQQCVAQRMQMASEDAQRLLDDSQRIMKSITRSLPKGWPTGAQ